MVTKSKQTDSIPDDSAVIAIERIISKDQFTSVQSWEDALALAEETYGELTTSDQFGDGFVLLKKEEKDKLLKVPFLILDSTLVTSDEFTRNGEPTDFATLRVVAKTGEKYIIVDGSTGICEQIKEWRAKTGRRGGFVCMNGLRKSEYTYTDKDGDTSPAVTYYLDESGS